jgi:hypothetical protein
MVANFKRRGRREEMRNRKVEVLSLAVLLMLLSVEFVYGGITDQQIKAASKMFIGTMSDWMPSIIGAGLIGSGICLFANNFKMGIAGLAGTGFLYAAKAFVGTGEGGMIEMAEQLLKAIS